MYLLKHSPPKDKYAPTRAARKFFGEQGQEYFLA
jgi:hypothetical protein